ncbi:MAG: hypothetical protein Q7U89_00235 [Coriobacteriia bacterium]|nr:hypothetical protein [Coriobacteriia bacterium]
MAKAAKCAACGTNVYVTDAGTCPQGHGPESLSDYYEAPDMSPADHAVFDAPADDGKKGSRRTIIIVLVVLALLIVCGVGACVAGVFGLAAYSTTSEPTIESSIDAVPAEESGGDVTPPMLPDIDLESELYDVTTHFFPGFEPTGFYLVGDGTEDPIEFQIITAPSDVPEFRMVFTSYRYAESELSAEDDPKWFVGLDTGAVWERAPEDVTEGATLYEFAGTEPMLGDAQRAQIMAAFTTAHTGYVITNFGLISNVDIELSGIAEDELETWEGFDTSFQSSWHLDPKSGAWDETDFKTSGL